MRNKTANKTLQWLIKNICSNCIALYTGKQGMYSYEVATLAPVFEKSATEFKPKPKLLKYKNIVTRSKQ